MKRARPMARRRREPVVRRILRRAAGPVLTWVTRHRRGVIAAAGGLVAISAITLSVDSVAARIRSTENKWIRLRDIEVEGNRYLSDEELRKPLEPLIGRNIWSVDVDSLAAAMEEQPRVKRARVSRDVRGKLRVIVEERTPVLLLVTPEGLVEVDEEGVWLPPIPGRVTRDLVLVTGMDRGGREGVRQAISLIEALRRRAPQLEHRLSEIDLSAAPHLVAYTVEDLIRIDFAPDDFDRQADRLAVVLANLETEPVPARRIDLRFGKRVFVQPGAKDDSARAEKG